MQLEYAKNPIWSNEEHTMIDLVIKWQGVDEEFPFTAAKNDCEAHGRQIFELASAGQYGEIDAYVPPPEPVEELPFPTPPSGAIPSTTFE
jgi:hypothetical protein